MMENVLILAGIAPFLGVLVTLLGQQHTIVKEQRALRKEQNIVRKEVVNSHTINLRDDLDEKHMDLKYAIDELREIVSNNSYLLYDHIRKCNERDRT